MFVFEGVGLQYNSFCDQKCTILEAGAALSCTLAVDSDTVDLKVIISDADQK